MERGGDLKIIFIKSRKVFGLVRPDSPVGDYIHYRALDYGMGCKLCQSYDVIDLTDYIQNVNDWKIEEIQAITMVMPEFSLDLLTSAAKFAKVAG